MTIGRGHPASPLRIVRLVELRHRLAYALVRVEVLLQLMPVEAIILLQLLDPGRVSRHALREAGLEHEGHRALELVRLQLGVARALEGLPIGTVRQHGVVQRHAARHEAAAVLAS